MKDTLKIFENIIPKIINTKYGQRKLYEIDMPEGFWDIWNYNKNELKEMGIAVSKYTGEWKLQKWEKFNEEKEGNNDKENFLKLIDKVKIDKVEKLLLPFQKKHVKNLILSLSKFQSVLDASGCGLGKTYTSLAIAKQNDLYPVVITKKSVKTSFERVMKEHFKMNGFVSNYESYRLGKPECIKIIEETDKRKKCKKKFIWNVPKNVLMIWDEAHGLKGRGTLQSKMFLDAVNQGLKNILLSATIADNSMDLQNIGSSLGLFQRSNFFNFALNHGCENNGWGLQFTKNENKQKKAMMKIHNKIFPIRGSRLTEKDAKGSFPENTILPDVYDLGNKETKKANELYKEMKKEIEKLRNSKRKKDKERKGDTPIMVLQQQAWQEVELLKIPIIAELALDAIEEAKSIVIFLNFKQSLLALKEKLNFPLIWGENKKGERDLIIDNFQKNQIKGIICNMKSGGESISLHDLDGKYPRMSIINPSYDGRGIIQVLGRIYRAGGKSRAIQKLVYAKGTIEENICESVKKKINNLRLLNDGNLAEEFLI